MAEETILDSGTEEETSPTGDTNWRDSLPDDLKEAGSLSDIPDVPTLAKAFIDTKAMVGADKVVLPAKDAGEEAWGPVWEKLGRPESPEGYEVPTENMPETMAVDPEGLKDFFKEAHSMGLNKQQAAALVRFQAKAIDAAQAKQTEAYEADKEGATNELRKEFGSAYEQNMTMAREAVKKFGGDELFAYLNETGLGNDPRLVKAFASIGKAIAEDEVIGGGRGQSFVLSPTEAKSAISAKRIDGEFMEAYTGRDHPAHKDAVREMERLHVLAFPSQG